VSRFSSNTRRDVSRQPITRVPVPFSQRDLLSEAVLGNLDVDAVNKFGCATNMDSGIPTDIWSRANSVDDQPIWVAPTQARLHDIASTDAGDALAGVGMHSVIVYGLPTWDTEETSEVIVMNGTTPVATVNSYVIIHRILGLSWGALGPNIGTITATAQVDATVTAQIQPLRGQTSMLVYGIPSVRALLIHQTYAYALQGGMNADVGMSMLVNPIPEIELAGFITRFEFTIKPASGVGVDHTHSVPTLVQGPAIIKIQGLSNTVNVGVAVGMDGLLADIERVHTRKILPAPPPLP
jgi:hypothetical protein